MAKIQLTIPDGQFCSDKRWLDCQLAQHDAGIHWCCACNTIMNEMQEIIVNGERIRTREKLAACKAMMQGNDGNAFVPG